MLTIDGSHNEGGGQILRTALALSLVTQTPFRIEKIRAGRKKPGLLRQHLTAVKAAAEIGRATVSGDAIGSQELTFTPRAVEPGDYKFAIGTAGSTTLVLQTVLPALMRASKPSRLTIEGGTHNASAPPYEFIAKSFVPLANRMGAQIEATITRYGFFPAGGGQIVVSIEPSKSWQVLDLTKRGVSLGRQGRAIIANLSCDIGQRELKAVAAKLSWDPACLQVEQVESHGPGNVILLEVEHEHITEVFVGFGERGLPAESVAEHVVQEARRYLASDVAVGEYLADQLLLPLALGKGGAYRTYPLSRHAQTNIHTIQQFLDVPIRVTSEGSRACRIEICA